MIIKYFVGFITILVGCLLIITLSLASYSHIHHGDYSKTGKYLDQFFNGEFTFDSYKHK